jgi:hypothetical protein
LDGRKCGEALGKGKGLYTGIPDYLPNKYHGYSIGDSMHSNDNNNMRREQDDERMVRGLDKF